MTGVVRLYRSRAANARGRLTAAAVGVAAATLAACAHAGASASAGATSPPPPSDTAAILASARPEIEAANAAWLPGLRNRDAQAIVAAYADSGVFVGPNGDAIRGRDAIARLYESRFPLLGTVLGGDVVQGGMKVVDGRIYEWGRASLELSGRNPGDPPRRSGGDYLTVWQRDAAGHWRIVRNLAF